MTNVVDVLSVSEVSIEWTFIVFQTIHEEVTPTVATPVPKMNNNFNFGEFEHLEFPMNIPMIRLKVQKIGF